MRELLLVAGIGLVVSGGMAFAWAVGQIGKSKEQRGITSIVCRRCGELVSINNVSADYFAYCSFHDEDLYEFETKRVRK
jgi:ribosomal protein L37E